MDIADRLLSTADAALRTLTGAVHASRANPADAAIRGPGGRADQTSAPPDAQARRLSGSLMRVNHVGEVCAQAMYQAQALTARTPALREQMLAAAREESDHLAWTQERLDELGARPSLLNPLWYAGAFTIGLAAGRLGDATSLGFVVETERQVEAHLASHLDRLPADDIASRRIVEQMKADERAHGDRAEQAGAQRLPAPARWMMRLAARVMTATAHHV